MSIDRLRSHWGFTRMPFGRDLTPSMLHHHRSHAEAVARIAWCVEERALGVIAGEVGAGKAVAGRGGRSRHQPLQHPLLRQPLGRRPGPLLRHRVGPRSCAPLPQGRPLPPGRRALAAEESERGKRVVLVVDEAHLLDADQLEELRLLTGSEMDSRSFACLLVSQPTLRRRIKLGAFAALDQGISLLYAIPPMTQADTAEYLAHHLKLALLTELRPWRPWSSG